MASARGFSGGGDGGGCSPSAAARGERLLEQRAERSLLRGDWEGAERGYRLLVQRHSRNPVVYSNLAAILAMRQRSAELEPLLRRALELEPDDPVVHNNLGQVLVQRGALTQAQACFAAALERDPAYPPALTNLANLRLQQGALLEAISLHERALAAAPSDVEAQWNLAHPLLLQGDYQRGFQHYDQRFALREPIQPHAMPPLPLWDGSPLPPEGGPLVLVSEQGLGDTLQFMRLAPLVRQRHGCAVWLSVQSKLEPLARSSALADRLVSHADLAQVRCGQWLPLLSLPGRLGIEPTTPLPPLPPLRPSPAATARWAGRLAAADPEPFRVGIHWQGDPAHETTSLRGRSLPLECLAPLADIPEVRLVSLQRGHGQEQLDRCTFRDRFSRAQAGMEAIWAFDDLAAIVEQCQLVISSDSAMVHLAAGLGRPTWVLLQAIPEWRWGLASPGTFWYPSVRLFRQTVAGDWAGPIATVAASLREQIASGAIAPC